MTESQRKRKETYTKNQAARVAAIQEASERKKIVAAGLEAIIVSADATTDQKLEAARLLIEMDKR